MGPGRGCAGRAEARDSVGSCQGEKDPLRSKAGSSRSAPRLCQGAGSEASPPSSASPVPMALSSTPHSPSPVPKAAECTAAGVLLCKQNSTSSPSLCPPPCCSPPAAPREETAAPASVAWGPVTHTAAFAQALGLPPSSRSHHMQKKQNISLLSEDYWKLGTRTHIITNNTMTPDAPLRNRRLWHAFCTHRRIKLLAGGSELREGM